MGKSNNEILEGINNEILSFNIESESELMRVERVASENNKIVMSEELFSGSTAIAISYEEPISAAKVIKDFNKDHDLPLVKGILFEGDYLPPEEFIKIASLPSKEESIAKFAIMVKSPIRNLAMALRSPMSDLVNILNSLKKYKSN